jgi:quercetin dioxygenase-like cupin family protein
MKVHKKIVIGALLLLPLLAGTALATPGVGVLRAPVHARGTYAHELNVHSHAGVTLETASPVDFVTQEIVLEPGGTTGWHSHPGPVLVTVKTGELTLVYADDASCEGTTYRAGESFVDRGDETVHTAVNNGSTEVELWATYLIPGEPGAPARLDSPSTGGCPF